MSWKGCLFTGVNAYHCKYSVVLKGHGGAWLFATLVAKTLRKCYFYLDKPNLPCTILLADSSTVFASKRCATCALNIPMGIYHHKFHEVRSKRPPPFRDQSNAQGGWAYTPNFTVPKLTKWGQEKQGERDTAVPKLVGKEVSTIVEAVRTRWKYW